MTNKTKNISTPTPLARSPSHSTHSCWNTRPGTSTQLIKVSCPKRKHIPQTHSLSLSHTHNTHWTHTHAHNTHTDYKVQVALHVVPEATTQANDKHHSCAYETGEGDVEDGNSFDGNRFDAPPESNTTTDYGPYEPQLRRFRSEQGQVLIKVCSIDLRTNQGMTVDVFTNQGM